MKKPILRYSLALTLTALMGVAQAATITVTTDVATGPGSLTAAINALNNGDTIAFNIPGAGVHYIQTPADGYPLITKNNITIDGYTQPGSSANTASIHAANNAVLKICLTSTNGNALSMYHACTNSFGANIPRLGYGDDEQAILGFFHATNSVVKGLAILSAPLTATSIEAGTCKGICYAANSAENGGGQCENFRISGCWFGVEPTTRQVAYLPDGTTVASPGICIASYRTRNAAAPDNTVYNYPGTIGVAAGSANPQAEFNVIITGYGFDAEGLNYRFSGNFWNVLPDGVTRADMTVLNLGAQAGDGYIEIGRSADNVTVGTDGDGVNDAEEGNIFGGWENGGPYMLYLYSSSTQTNYVVAGNWFNVGVDGTTIFPNAAALVHSFNASARARFGSDFDGVSDALEGNRIYNITNAVHKFFDGTGNSLSAGIKLSFRGNSTVNNEIMPYSYADGFDSRSANFTNYEATVMDPATNSVIPSLDPTSIYPHLKGTFALGTNGYTTIIVDVYQLDQQGWNEGKAIAGAGSWPELTDNATYTNGFAQGSKYLGSRVVPNTGNFDIDVSGMDLGVGHVVVTVNYSLDPSGTHNGRVHTGNFSSPVAMIPGGADSVGLTRIVPDTLVWFSSADNTPRIGNFVAGQDVANGGSVEASASVLGDSTFLLAASMKADDGTSMRFTSVYQPAAGGAPKLGDLFYSDGGVPYTNKINESRQDGNPGRVAGDPRYGAVNFIGAGEVSLWAYPTFFNSDGRFDTALPFYAAMATGNARDACVQTYALNPATLSQTMLSKAKDSAFGGLTGSAPGAGADAGRFSRTGGTVVGLDNGNFVSVVEDRSRLFNPAGNSSTATIFAPNGNIVKAAFSVANADQWANVGAFKGGFYVRPSGGVIYFYDNAGNLMGTNAHNVTSGLSFDVGRGDGTRTCSDIRSHYVFMAGRAPDNATGPVWLAVFDANTRAFVTKAVVSDTDTALHALDRVNVACDALNRVCVTFRLRPIAFDFGSQQIAARVLSFDGATVSYLTHSFFPFTSHDSVGGVNNFITQESWPAMTTREIFIYAEGTVNSTNNPAGLADTAPQTHVYTVLSHPAPVAAPRPVITMSKSGGTLDISWNPADGLFTVQTRSVVDTGAWANATAGNVAPPVSISAGAGPLFIRLAR